jgi:uncharacterized protein YecE (DUF72 family)
MAAMPTWRIGTTGFTDPDWAGPFYPRTIKSGEHLPFYARFFNATEIDTTFHAAPNAERVKRWAAQVPPDFRFCVKTPKAVTHGDSIDHVAGDMLGFCDAVRHFGDLLGAVLIQFPPSLPFGAAPHLEKLLDALPADLRFAVEFRHDSWNNPRTAEILRARRCAWVMADYMAKEPWHVPATTDFLYVRWIGIHERFDVHTAEQIDVTDRLTWWKRELERDAAAENATIYAMFNNDYAGYALGTANRFRKVLGIAAPAPTAGDRGELFG